jgi:dynein heavy chain
LRMSLKQLKLFLDLYDEPQIDALVYLTAECNYGGRVTDDIDRRLVKSLLKTFYCNEILENKIYKFTQIDDYYIPNNTKYDLYLDYIQRLPQNTHPELFGLHENANIRKDTHEMQTTFDSILLTLPRQVFVYFMRILF